MKDVSYLYHFLGIEVIKTTKGLHLYQTHYALKILDRAKMTDCKPMNTPLEIIASSIKNNASLDDPSLFRGIVGALQYLTLTHPDLTFSVNFVS